MRLKIFLHIADLCEKENLLYSIYQLSIGYIFGGESSHSGSYFHFFSNHYEEVRQSVA